MLGGESIFGVSGEDIRRVGALPLKNFRLSAPPVAPRGGTRGGCRSRLKETTARELELPVAPPPSLSMRDQDWYQAAVVPMIGAIFADDRRRLIGNCIREDGLVSEVPARVSRFGVEVVSKEPPAQVKPWLDRWAAHERALLEAVASPSPERIEETLALHPVG